MPTHGMTKPHNAFDLPYDPTLPFDGEQLIEIATSAPLEVKAWLEEIERIRNPRKRFQRELPDDDATAEWRKMR